MKKKVLSMLLAVNILGIALSGCGDSASDDAAKASDNSQKEETTEQSKETTETETETPTETVTVKVLMSAGWTEDAIDAIRPQLKEKGIELDVEAYDSATYEGKQRLACSSKGGEYDVVFLPGNVVNTYANAGALIPMNDVVEDMGFTDDDYYASVRKFTKVGDDWYAVPYSAECMVYFYRTDLISEDQVPTTIDEMYELGKSLTNGDTYGCAIPAQSGEAACSMWSYFLWSYGGDYFDENWYPTLNTPEAVEAAEMFAKIDQDCAPEGITTWQDEETIAAFQNGQIASMVIWPGYWGMLSDPEQCKVYDKIGVAPVPAGPNGARPRFGTWGVGVTANCKNVEAAKEVVKEYCNKENMSARLDLCPSAVKEVNEVENAQEINYTLPANCASLDTADERPPIPEINSYISAVGAAINSVIAGNPAQEVMDAVNEEVKGIMEEAGYY
ncbi:MAG: extracellular solute-binding protein [Oliverpabstia sp.]